MAQHVSGAYMPITRRIQLHQQLLVLLLESGGSSVVGRGLAGCLCVVQHFSGAYTPIIRSIQLHQQPLVLPLESGGSSVVGRGLAG